MASLLVDRFGRDIPSVQPDTVEMFVDGLPYTNIESQTREKIIGLHTLLMGDGKKLVAQFNEDLIDEKAFKEKLDVLVANMAILEMLIKDKAPKEEDNVIVEA